MTHGLVPVRGPEVGDRRVSRTRQRSEKLVDGAGSCSPSQGSGQRGWNLSLERWGEKSVSGGVHCSWGGRLGRLFSASNNTASGSHCCRVKGTNWGGHTGEGTILHSGQWEKRFHVWVGAAEWVECWGFRRVFPTALLTINVEKCYSWNSLVHTFWSCLVTHVFRSSLKGSRLHQSSAHRQSRTSHSCWVFERSCRYGREQTK